MISDRGRTCAQNPHWTDAKNFLEEVAPQFRLDLWEDQANYVEVMVEKQALEGVLLPVCRNYDVPFSANKGYTSSSALYQASKRFLLKAHENRELHVIYLGDHDPSGIDMSRDILDRLCMFVRTSWCDIEGCDMADAPELTVHRIALNMDQIDELKPPENPAKLTDSRATAYIERFGYSSWELDAIEPAKLAKLVADNIEDLMDHDRFAREQKEQRGVRQALIEFGERYDGE